MGADLGLDLLRHLGIVLEEVAGVVLALADAVPAVAVPGAGFLDQLVEHAQFYDLAFARNAFAIKYVELSLAERRRHLVLDHLGAGLVADHLFALLDRARPWEV